MSPYWTGDRLLHVQRERPERSVVRQRGSEPGLRLRARGPADERLHGVEVLDGTGGRLHARGHRQVLATVLVRHLPDAQVCRLLLGRAVLVEHALDHHPERAAAQLALGHLILSGLAVRAFTEGRAQLVPLSRLLLRDLVDEWRAVRVIRAGVAVEVAQHLGLGVVGRRRLGPDWAPSAAASSASPRPPPSSSARASPSASPASAVGRRRRRCSAGAGAAACSWLTTPGSHSAYRRLFHAGVEQTRNVHCVVFACTHTHWLTEI